MRGGDQIVQNQKEWSIKSKNQNPGKNNDGINQTLVKCV